MLVALITRSNSIDCRGCWHGLGVKVAQALQDSGVNPHEDVITLFHSNVMTFPACPKVNVKNVCLLAKE